MLISYDPCLLFSKIISPAGDTLWDLTARRPETIETTAHVNGLNIKTVCQRHCRKASRCSHACEHASFNGRPHTAAFGLVIFAAAGLLPLE